MNSSNFFWDVFALFINLFVYLWQGNFCSFWKSHVYIINYRLLYQSTSSWEFELYSLIVCVFNIQISALKSKININTYLVPNLTSRIFHAQYSINLVLYLMDFVLELLIIISCSKQAILFCLLKYHCCDNII